MCRALRSGLRDVLVRLGAIAEVIIGLLWAMQRPAPAPPVECNRTAGEAGTGCFSEAFVAVVLPYVTAIGLGVVAGAVTGLLVAQLLIGRERPTSRRPSRGAATASAAPADARWSTAR